MFSLVAIMGFSGAVNASEDKKMGDASKGKALSATCAACHGADGNSTNPEWPKLAGQNEAYLVKQLMDYRSGKRTNATMNAMAKGIPSDQAVRDISAYFASSKAKPGSAADKDKLALGEQIYRGGVMESGVAACSGCHSPNGAGNPAAKFPKISGQHAQYTIAQLKQFKSEARANDAGKMMRNVALKMTDSQMEAVAEYISGLRD